VRVDLSLLKSVALLVMSKFLTKKQIVQISCLESNYVVVEFFQKLSVFFSGFASQGARRRTVLAKRPRHIARESDVSSYACFQHVFLSLSSDSASWRVL
jgi:hypothetical protein